MVELLENEVLISLVEARPVLWDKTSDLFKDRNLTRDAWREVCCALNHEFEVMEDKEKNAFGKEVTKRWGNLRDAFFKSKRKLNEWKRSGGGARKMKRYVYADQMQFLNKLLQTREFAESLETENNEDEDVGTQSDSLLPAKQTIRETTKPQHYKRRRRPDEFELQMLKALQEPPLSPHISFFQGILPHLNKFDDSEILDFQMGVLEVISKINKKRKNTVQPQPLAPQTPLNYPSIYSLPQYQSFPTTQMSYSNQFGPINSFQPQQHQNHQSSKRNGLQTHRQRNTDSNSQQACSSKGKPLERQEDQTIAQYNQDLGRPSPAISPETYPSSNPSPAGSIYSDTTYDFS